MLGINLVSMVKAELLKYKDKSGTPVAVDALDKVEKGLVVLGNFMARFNEQDITAILNALPPSVKEKFPPAEIAAFSTAVVAFPKALTDLEVELTKVEASLKS